MRREMWQKVSSIEDVNAFKALMMPSVISTHAIYTQM